MSKKTKLSYFNHIPEYNSITEFKLITLTNGKKFFMYKKYTYGFHLTTKTGARWQCSSGCKAYLLVSSSGQLIKAAWDHPHPPPVYHQTTRGEYIRVK